ncbi:MAG: aconitate hydratase AcnA [Hydrogenophilales bacterium CG17_big_fil_post_rev_8_21_14_2_50_63_12]|nr:MAG: aconitate hydratase AcnA [Hydrogenophilales bacterium CG17_big_fil_post_rev_8_21_14_2_50_63_12]PIX98011.1 MAG: aconitate hydratase AcnA [Hydrogenophilales bacterium CG_4_10_14_3_um_filter_63_21]PJB02644.1 MAG: aconitate hydratase AcnA [Hydrogenophilales bacterium CG_4_9_14_3_um_filter_63_34]
MHNLFDTRQTFDAGNGKSAFYYSLPQLEKAGVGAISRLPVSIRIVLESVLRNFDGLKITEQHVRELANWQPNATRTEEIPFLVARILLQDFTGVPLLADLAAMRSAAQRAGKDASKVEPLAPVEMVVDHSVQVDVFGRPDALEQNMKIEFARNRERYQFLKWGMQAFDTFKVVPPGVGIVHQVNMEYLARGVMEKEGVYYPDTLVGTDSHTTMINGLGVVGWGVGGIEAEAGMLGQPVYFLTPDVVGVQLTGHAAPGVTATDIVLTITEMLRRAKVVGKFVEFFGEGACALPVTDRATIANMAPEYGATMGFFPVDEATCQYYLATGRDAAQVDALRNYFKAQNLFGVPQTGSIEYSQILELDLGGVKPSVAGPKRPQDRINLYALKETFETLFSLPKDQGGYGKEDADLPVKYTLADGKTQLGQGDVVIAAITSCTNTSNPGVMLAAGLLAKKAVGKGMVMPIHVKTSMGPGSRAVSEYLKAAGLLEYLDKLGFGVVGYGCTTCIGNSGPLPEQVEKAILEHDLVACSVLSGNRNFEARVHQNVKANFLMSPPLVVAFALAGHVDIDMATQPIGEGRDGPVYLKDIWPSHEEVAALLHHAADPGAYRIYKDVGADNPLWDAVPAPTGQTYTWDDTSTYIQEPPFFQDANKPNPVIHGARALAIFGDSVTTDHISPAGGIKATSPAGKYLIEHGVAQKDFNSYGARRGNHEVMMRGTFANVRIKNLMIPGSEGGVTLHFGEQMSLYDAAMAYQAIGIPLIVLAGEEYGTGSSRDWAAKGTQLLGVKAVVAKSFERIHRANLAGMGVLPIQFKDGQGATDFKLDGSESFDLVGLEKGITPRQDMTLVIHRADGSSENVAVKLRLDTPIEIEYFQAGGILPYVLKQLLG